jgi:CNT family concentrative nucleoside transporter
MGAFMADGTNPAQAATPMAWRVGLGAGVLLVGGAVYLLAVVPAAAESASPAPLIGPRVQAFLGMFCILGLVAMCSTNLRAVAWRTLAWGFALQWLLGLFILRFELSGLEALGIEGTIRPGYRLFEIVGAAVNKFLEFPSAGTRLLFGKMVDMNTMQDLFGEEDKVIFAFAVLPSIIFVSSVFTVLYYLGVLQWVVRVCARGMVHLMGTSGAETLSSVANVFMGQTEAPLIVKPYVAKMTQSELLAMMVGGMATISGGLMAVYISKGADPVAILATSVMAAPCGLYLSKLLLPETEASETRGIIKTSSEMPYRNVIDAAASGASDGLFLVLNVAAMLIAFMGIIAMINYLLGMFPIDQTSEAITLLFDIRQGGWYAVGNWLMTLVGYLPLWLLVRKLWTRQADDPARAARFGPIQAVAFVAGYAVFVLLVILAMAYLPVPLSLNWIFSQFFAPLALLMGVQPRDMYIVADLLGTKLAVNEFVAYIELTSRYRSELSPRSYKLATYALTGFANFASVGIQIGGIGALAPERRSDLARLGMRALFVGFLTTVMNACVAGILIDE